MKQSILSRNTVLLLAAGFFYFASPMMVTPLITGFCEELGAGAALMGMAGGYGIMSSVCQSRAIVTAGREHAGLGNTTYYIGLDLGMTLGPVLGGVLYGSLDIRLFDPVLLLTVPAVIAVYALNRRVLK